MTLAPIVLFAYNRPWHTRQTIEALQKNELAEESELFIYSDAPKSPDAKKSVDEVRAYIKTIDGFKKVTIIEREKNWGLANSIIDGVTGIVNKYGKIIVLEDDLVTSPCFLKYMNNALAFYKDEKKVWHISGWNYSITSDDKNGTFFWRAMNCWGWATWADRWQFYEKNTEKLLNEFTKKDIKKFNIDGSENFWGQVIANKEHKIDTWAIYWYATIFRYHGLCLNPVLSYVENIGCDSSGHHCDDRHKIDSRPLNQNPKLHFNSHLIENDKMLKEIKRYYRKKRKSVPVRIVNKLSKLLMGDFFKQ
jgi:hypothetical protein